MLQTVVSVHDLPAFQIFCYLVYCNSYHPLCIMLLSLHYSPSNTRDDASQDYYRESFMEVMDRIEED